MTSQSEQMGAKIGAKSGADNVERVISGSGDEREEGFSSKKGHAEPNCAQLSDSKKLTAAVMFQDPTPDGVLFEVPVEPPADESAPAVGFQISTGTKDPQNTLKVSEKTKLLHKRAPKVNYGKANKPKLLFNEPPDDGILFEEPEASDHPYASTEEELETFWDSIMQPNRKSDTKSQRKNKNMEQYETRKAMRNSNFVREKLELAYDSDLQPDYADLLTKLENPSHPRSDERNLAFFFDYKDDVPQVAQPIVLPVPIGYHKEIIKTPEKIRRKRQQQSTEKYFARMANYDQYVRSMCNFIATGDNRPSPLVKEPSDPKPPTPVRDTPPEDVVIDSDWSDSGASSNVARAGSQCDPSELAESPAGSQCEPCEIAESNAGSQNDPSIADSPPNRPLRRRIYYDVNEWVNAAKSRGRRKSLKIELTP